MNRMEKLIGGLLATTPWLVGAAVLVVAVAVLAMFSCGGTAHSQSTTAWTTSTCIYQEILRSPNTLLEREYCQRPDGSWASFWHWELIKK